MRKSALILLIAFMSWLIVAGAAFARQSAPLDTGKVVASLVSSHDSIAPGGTFHIALRTQLDEHWHTYWKNPGDSGEPVHIEWSLPEGISPGPIIWPLPKPVPTGPIINYGFEGAPLFTTAFTVSETAKLGDVITLTADFYYLVCYDVCIPESGQLNLPISIGPSSIDDDWNAQINEALSASPKTGAVKGGVENKDGALTLSFTNLPEGDFSKAYFFPFDQGVLGHSEPQRITLADQGLKLETKADFLWEKDVPKSLGGVLTYEKEGVYSGTEVTMLVGEVLSIGAPAVAAKPLAKVSGASLFTAIIGALVGGLILNLMPCVFPVISIKALSIAKSAHGERAAIKREAWFYTSGVIAMFLLLTLILLSLKAGGSEIGWGFQLQSPKVVAGLALLLFVIGLNLLGAFEFGSGLQNTGASLTQKSGAAGSFFTGALAVVVATPCTAPMMAGAVGYALAAPALITLAVFMALAIGFALPFLLIAYVPSLLCKLPKPGLWMARFKEILAFPMFAAAIWLVWVLSLQAGEHGVLVILCAMLAASLAIWLFKLSGGLSRTLGVLAVIAALALPLTLSANTNASADAAAKLDAMVWSQARVDELLAQGRPVFVDFTAAWCVTCKINEKTVLYKAKTQKLFEDTNTAFLVADWTNKDDVIAAELAKYGRAGVPLYLVYSPNFQEFVRPAVLPQILTYNVIIEALAGS